MLRKLLVAFIATAVIALSVSGCKKKSEPAPPPTPKSKVGVPKDVPKTAEELKAQAEKEITKKNMASELDKLEKAIDKDVAAESNQP